MVSPALPTAADAIIEVQSWINDLGVRKAFKIVGMVLLYSGPRQTIVAAFPAYNRNYRRAAEKSGAKLRRHTIIDQTEVGQRLGRYDGKNNLYGYFLNIYGADQDADGRFVYEKHAYAVMAYASEKLVQIAKGDVETLVCGADLKIGIFFTVELPALLKNPKVISINGVSADRLRKIYFSGRPDAAYQTFRKVCQGELALARKRVAAAKTKKAKAALREEYELGRAYFVMERREAIAALVVIPSPSVVTSASAPMPPAFIVTASHSHSHSGGVRLH